MSRPLIRRYGTRRSLTSSVDDDPAVVFGAVLRDILARELVLLRVVAVVVHCRDYGAIPLGLLYPASSARRLYSSLYSVVRKQERSEE